MELKLTVPLMVGTHTAPLTWAGGGQSLLSTVGATRGYRVCHTWLPCVPHVATGCATRGYHVCHTWLPGVPHVATGCVRTRTRDARVGPPHSLPPCYPRANKLMSGTRQQHCHDAAGWLQSPHHYPSNNKK